VGNDAVSLARALARSVEEPVPEPHGRYTLTQVTLERKGEVGPGVSVRRWIKPGTTISSEMSKVEAKL
jgi:hypothetical protein